MRSADWGRTSTEANDPSSVAALRRVESVEGKEGDPWEQTFGLIGLEGHGAGAVTCFLRWLQLVAQNGSRREAC